VRPTVLVITTPQWLSMARLSMTLADVGCTVKALCPASHPLRKTSAVQEAYEYRALVPIASLLEAIERSKPDIIIPGDDLAVQHLHQVYYRQLKNGESGADICALIERSLGAPESFPIVYARSEFINLAEQEGVRVPKTKAIADIQELKEWGSQMGYPSVLKANGSWGGDGVRVVRSQREAEHAFRRLQAPPMVARVAKRVFVDGDTTLLGPLLSRHRSAMSAQAYIAGREATSLVVCWQGAVLASLHFEVLCKQDATGPACVVRVKNDPDMISAAGTMVRRLNLSGFVGFDFMLDNQTGNAYLIEINPRATQVAHLRLGPGHDLPAAFYSAITSGTVRETTKVTENDTIAMFPQELLRNPGSAFLRSGYHDVPWEQPGLLRDCLRPRRKWSGLFSPKKWNRFFSEAWLPKS